MPKFRTAGDGLDLELEVLEERRGDRFRLEGDCDGFFSVYMTDEAGFDFPLF